MPKRKRKPQRCRKRTRVYDQEFEVEDILDKKVISGKNLYKVKWRGYSNEECTWEPAVHLSNAWGLVERFENIKSECYIDPTMFKSSSLDVDPLDTICLYDGIRTLSIDIPEKIKSRRISEGRIYYKVQWETNEDGTKPEDSEIPSIDLKLYYPNLVIDFYESEGK